MVEYHNKAFFGSKVGMFFDSGSWTSPFFYLKFIKKRDNNTWEKPSLRQGKSIKFSLEDTALILRVLNQEALSWNTVHVFKENKTHISFQWEKGNKERLHVNGGEYHKMLNYAEIIVFKSLLEHVFGEKIVRSTVISRNGSFKKSVGVQSGGKNPELIVTEEIIRNTRSEIQTIVQVTPMHLKNELTTEPETVTIKGVCKGETEKALLIEFEEAQQIWIPKSTIRSGFDPRSVAVPQFKIDIQALRKNHHSENLLSNKKTIIKV